MNSERTFNDTPGRTIGGTRAGSRQRPFGLRAIMVLLTLQAVVLTVLLVLELLPLVIAHQIPAASTEAFRVILLTVAGLTPTAAAAIGLWADRRWAWYLTMLLLAVMMTTDIWNFFHGHPVYVSMLLNVIMVFYLNQQEVRSLFMDRVKPAEQPVADRV